jgi:hypothetical protein
VSIRYRRWLVATLGMVLVAGVLVEDVGARAHPTIVAARIHGRRFKSRGVHRGQAVVAGFALDPLVSLLTFGGSKLSGLRSIRSVGIGCPIYNYTPATATFPMTLTCNGNYHEMRLGRTLSTKGWSTSNGIQVVLNALDSTGARGTFSGTIETPDSTNAGDGPAAVQSGKFDVVFSVVTGAQVGSAGAR